MSWLDRIMDRLTARGTKMVAGGHPPADTEPETGSGEISQELQADYAAETPATEPPPPPPPPANDPPVG